MNKKTYMKLLALYALLFNVGCAIRENENPNLAMLLMRKCMAAETCKFHGQKEGEFIKVKTLQATLKKE